MSSINQVQIKARWALGLVCVAASGCSNSEHGAPNPPAVPTASSVSVASAPQHKPAANALAVPPSFRPSYTLKEDENISLGKSDTRRKVRIIVPAALSDADVGNNMRSAAKKAYRADHSPHAIVVFAYKPGTDIHNQYTAGRLQWAPSGDWMRADEDVPVEAHEAVIDIAEDYRAKPKVKRTASQKRLDALFANVDSEEKSREAKANRRISESRRRRIYFAYQGGMHIAMSNPNVDNALKENDASIAARYHLTADELDSISTEGDTQGWPQPE